MAFPTTLTMQLTPQATLTVSEGIDTGKDSAFFQRVTGNVAIVYDGVPYALGKEIMASSDPDTAIRTQLSGYPKRIVAV